MRWTIETDEDDVWKKQRVLEVSADEPLEEGYLEFWRRILSAATSVGLRGWTDLALEIREKQSADEAIGRLRAQFKDYRGRVETSLGTYVLRSDRLTCIESGNKTNFLRQLHFYLEHYQALKRAVRAPELAKLRERVQALGPKRVRANTGWGAFDFQLDSDDFGILPPEDRALLAGKEPRD